MKKWIVHFDKEHSLLIGEVLTDDVIVHRGFFIDGLVEMIVWAGEHDLRWKIIRHLITSVHEKLWPWKDRLA